MSDSGIAQAILHDPPVLILDEPTHGLDPNQVLEVRELVRELGRERTVLFSSHDISEVERVCDRIGILSGGRLVKLMSQDEWRGKTDALETAFTAAVVRTDGVGPIRME